LHVHDAVGDDALGFLLGLDRWCHVLWTLLSKSAATACAALVTSRATGPARKSLLDRTTRTFARARIGARTLTTHRQAAAMAQTAIRAEVDQPLDADADFATQVAFHREARDFLAQLFHLAFGQRLDRRGRIDPGLRADRLRPRAADAVDALQAHPHVLVDRQVDTRDARHLLLPNPIRCQRGKLLIIAEKPARPEDQPNVQFPPVRPRIESGAGS